MVWILFYWTPLTPELYASLDEADAIPSSGFLCSVISVSDTSRLQLAPSIKSDKLSCHARALLLPVLQAGIMSASNLIYLSGHPAAFGLWASLALIISH